MAVKSCIPVIPSANLEKSLRLWVDGLGFEMDTEMRAEGRLIFCMLHKGDLCFMLNQRAGTPVKPDNYGGVINQTLLISDQSFYLGFQDTAPPAP